MKSDIGTTVTRQEKFPTINILASAIIAFRTNGRVYREFVRTDEAEYQPNRLIMTNALHGNHIDKEALEEAELIHKFLNQTHIMQTLTVGKPDGFLHNILEILSLPETTARDFGILAWAPKLFSDLKH
jgi:hypothetical protein